MIVQNQANLLDVIIGLKKIKTSSADCIIIDPPYNIKKDFGTTKDNMELKQYTKWVKKWMRECDRILKDTGTLFVYGFSEILAHISVNIKLNHRWLIWHYTNKTTPSSNFWQRSHEALIVCWKNNRIFNRDDIREPYTETFLKNSHGKTRKNTKGRFCKGEKQTTYVAHKKGALPRDVIKIPAMAGGAGTARWFFCKSCNDTFFMEDFKTHEKCITVFHPTQKPMKLTEKLLLSCIPKNHKEVFVVIPFIGSGSEALACKKMGFNFVGFDLNEDYILMTNNLLNKTGDPK